MPSGSTEIEPIEGHLNTGSPKKRVVVSPSAGTRPDSPTIVSSRRKSLMNAVEERAIPWQFVISQFQLQVASRELVSDLFVYIPFLVMFVFFFLVGRQVGDSYFIVNSMRDAMISTEFPEANVPKYFTTIDEAKEWNSWYSTVVIDTLWPPGRDGPYTYNSTEQLHMVQGQNLLLGKMRARTLRMSNNSCIVNHFLYPDAAEDLARDCYNDYNSNLQATEPYGGFQGDAFKWLPADNVSGSWTSGEVNRYPAEGYVTELDFRADRAAAVLHAAELAENDFVDNLATRFVVVEFFVYTPAFNTFTSCKMVCEVTAGGSWITTSQFRLFKLWTKADIGQTIYDFAFLAFVLYYVCKFVIDFVKETRRTKRPLGFITQMWNFLELVNLVVFLVVFGMRWAWWQRSVALDGVLPFLGQYPGELESILWLFSLQVYLNSVNTVLSFLKLLKFVRLNDRLNILTRTMEACQQNIIGVLVLFIFVVFGYSITGNTLFGNGMWNWRSLSASFSTLMRMLLGDFDYPSMRDENRFLAGVFFWSFVILGLFLLLNFIIAIIAESFAKVNEEQASVPLDEQIMRSMKDFKRLFTWQAIKSRLVCGKNNQASLVQRLVDRLTIAYNSQVAQVGDSIEDRLSIMLRRSEMYRLLPEDIVARLGEFQIDGMWDEVEYEYERTQQNDKEMGKKEMQDRVQAGVAAALEEPIGTVTEVNERVNKLEGTLNSILNMLRAQEANIGTSASLAALAGAKAPPALQGSGTL